MPSETSPNSSGPSLRGGPLLPLIFIVSGTVMIISAVVNAQVDAQSPILTTILVIVGCVTVGLGLATLVTYIRRRN